MIPGVVAANTALVAASAAYPEIRSVVETISTAATHNTTITAAGRSEVGDRMIVMLSVNSSASITPPAGWSLISSGGISSSIGLSVYYRDKTADAASANFTVSGSANVASVSVAIKSGTYATDAPAESSQSSGFSTTTIDPAAATDAGGSFPQLVIAFGAHRSGTIAGLSISSYPTAANNRGVIGSAVTALMCTDALETNTYNPGAFVVSIAANNRGITLMQRGA